MRLFQLCLSAPPFRRPCDRWATRRPSRMRIRICPDAGICTAYNVTTSKRARVHVKVASRPPAGPAFYPAGLAPPLPPAVGSLNPGQIRVRSDPQVSAQVLTSARKAHRPFATTSLVSAILDCWGPPVLPMVSEDTFIAFFGALSLIGPKYVSPCYWAPVSPAGLPGPGKGCGAVLVRRAGLSGRFRR